MKKGTSTWWIWLLAGLGLLVGFFFIMIIALVALTGEPLPTGNVAHIQINGVILVDGDSPFADDVVSSRDIVSFIEQAEEDASIKGILIDINSPGGSAVASDEISQAVASAQKPTVALIRELGASGGYWVASSTDHVIANRMSITGSVGVISSYLEFSGLMEEYGIGYERLVSGDLKDTGTPLKKLNSKERAVLQKKLDRIHDFFIEAVAQNRDLSQQSVQQLATGEAYLGVEALDLGLVDELGGMEDAQDYLKEVAGLEDIKFAMYQKEPSFIDLLTGVMGEQAFLVGEGIGSSLVQEPDLTIMAR